MGDSVGGRERTVRDGVRRHAGIVRRVAKVTALVLAIIAASAVAIAAYHCASSPTLRDAVEVLVSGIDGPDEAFPGRDAIDILLMGRDADRDRHGRIVSTHGRTDTMILARVDFRGRRLNLLSIPRDTLVRIPGYRGKHRIAHANAYGGPGLAQKTVFDFLGVRPDYYVLLNFDSFEEAVDAIGGLEVEVDKQLDYDDDWGGLHIHLKRGRQVLNGKQAIGFVRYRQSNDGDVESDLVRITRQQEMLRAAKARLRDPSVAFRVARVSDMIYKDIECDLRPSQAACLARFLASLPESAVRMETLPAVNGGAVFVRPDMNAIGALLSEMFFENQE